MAERAPALLGGARDNSVKRGAPQQRLLALVEHRKMRCHLGLQRKALKQALAEAVNGVDLEAASGLQGLRKQPPRDADLRVLRRVTEQRRQPLL